MTRPDARSVSVVVQGPVVGAPDAPADTRLTLRCLESVRRHLPGAEVIVSTWPNADVTGLPFDRLVVSEDPGAERYDDGSMPSAPLWNGNRLIASTLAGLRVASRPYAMKLRSDMLLTDARCLRLFGRYPRRSGDWRLVRDRVLSPTFFACNPNSPRHYPFHPSDWWQFGWRDDLLDMWDVPFAGPDVPRWYCTRPQPPEEAEPRLVCRYFVEQYVWISFLRKHGEVPFEHKTDCNPDALRLSELAFANNLQLHDLSALGLRFPKAPIPFWVWKDIYTPTEWEALYRRYCHPTFRRRPDLRRLGFHAFELLHEPLRVRGATAFVRLLWRTSPSAYYAVRQAYFDGRDDVARRLMTR